MNKFIVLVTLTVMLGYGVSYSQNNVVGGVQAKGMDMNTNLYGTIGQFNLREKTSSGTSYLFDDWRTGSIVITSMGKISQYPVKLDLQHQQIEINTDDGIKVAPFARVDSFMVLNPVFGGNQLFVNARYYNGAEVHVAGLMEVLAGGNINLLKYHYVYVKESTYNAALDMGDDETKYIVKDKLFLFNRKTNDIVEVPSGKSKFLALFEDGDRKATEQFVDENKIKMKDEDDLKRLVEFLNKNEISSKAL